MGFSELKWPPRRVPPWKILHWVFVPKFFGSHYMCGEVREKSLGIKWMKNSVHWLRIPALILHNFLYRTERKPKFLSDYCTPISDNTRYFDINPIVLERVEKISFKDWIKERDKLNFPFWWVPELNQYALESTGNLCFCFCSTPSARVLI